MLRRLDPRKENGVCVRRQWHLCRGSPRRPEGRGTSPCTRDANKWKVPALLERGAGMRTEKPEGLRDGGVGGDQRIPETTGRRDLRPSKFLATSHPPAGSSPRCSYHRFPAHFAPSSPSSSALPTNVLRLRESRPTSTPSDFTSRPSFVVDSFPIPHAVDTIRYCWMRVLINSASVMFADGTLRHGAHATSGPACETLR